MILFYLYFPTKSEQEKQLRKQLRRGEKKARRKDVDQDQGEYIKALGFNPDELRAQRQVNALLCCFHEESF